jgi:hypothetical protein
VSGPVAGGARGGPAIRGMIAWGQEDVMSTVDWSYHRNG